MEIPGQICGIVAMLCCALSYQCKSNSKYYILQGLSGIFFSIQFLLIGAYSGLVFNVFNILRALIIEIGKALNKWVKIAILESMLLLCAAILIFAFAEKWYLVLLVLVAQATGTFAMCLRNGKLIRLSQLCVVSPLWLIYDCVIPIPSIGGILCESFNILSIFVSFLRFGKSGFDKS